MGAVIRLMMNRHNAHRTDTLIARPEPQTPWNVIVATR